MNDAQDAPRTDRRTDRQILLCLDSRVIRIREERTSWQMDGGRAEVTVDHAHPHNIVFPGWQELRFAVTGAQTLLLWSARSLLVLHVRSDTLERLFEPDEDIRLVHVLDGGLLVVCETSLRTVDWQGRQMGRLELPDVIVDVSLGPPSVTVTDIEGNKWPAALKGLDLLAASEVSG